MKKMPENSSHSKVPCKGEFSLNSSKTPEPPGKNPMCKTADGFAKLKSNAPKACEAQSCSLQDFQIVQKIGCIPAQP